MKLTAHERKIVSRINKGEIWDIPSYLRSFGKGRDQADDMDAIRSKFADDENGKKYKVMSKILKRIVLCFFICIGIIIIVNQCSQPKWACPYAVKINGNTYYLAEESSQDRPNYSKAGTIYSSVPRYKMPQENETGNFPECVGCPYIFSNEKVYVFYSGRWHAFEQRK